MRYFIVVIKKEDGMKSREEYIIKLAAQLKEWSSRIDELETKARAAKGDMKTSYENQLKQLRDKRDAATKTLQELKEASADAWDTLKAGAETAWADLKNSVTAAKERFK
jgi:predicted  nucleic acid-binding Zn-ribbon protein